MANDVPVTAPYRDYYLTAPKGMSAETVALWSGYLLKEDDDYLSQETATTDKIKIEIGVRSPQLKAPYRDYFLTASERQ